MRATIHQIEEFVLSKQEWIKKHQLELQKTDDRELLSEDDIRMLAKEAKKYIPSRVNFFAEIIGVDYAGISIRHQKTRWGSCSSKGGLNFNCLLMRAPQEIIDYVVVHELCHRKEMNHSPRFWKEVEQVLPNYRDLRRWLKTHGNELRYKNYEEESFK